MTAGILLGDYEKLVLNKYIQMDGAYGAQCWDLWAHYCKWLGVPIINTHGGAHHGWVYAIWDQFNANGAAEHWVKVSAAERMLQGDVPIWKPTAGYYPGSHIAIGVEDAGAAGLWCLSQNSAPSQAGNPYPGQSTAPTLKQLLPKIGLAGYLRRKTVATATVKTAERIVTASVAHVRTGPSTKYPKAPGYPNGIAKGAKLAVTGYVAGEDPYPNDGVRDDAWYVTKSGYYVWANAAGNSLAGLKKL